MRCVLVNLLQRGYNPLANITLEVHCCAKWQVCISQTDPLGNDPPRVVFLHSINRTQNDLHS